MLELSQTNRDWSDVDVQELLGKVAEHLSVRRAFGTAYEKGGSLVIPVALVAGGGGGGEGTSGSPTTDSIADGGFEGEDNGTDAEAPSGSGGGFGGLVMPVGVYVVKDEQVRWVPAVNANLVIVVAFMTVRMIARARRRAHRHAS
jgi:uncharacterized spore protein YtfJ